MGDGHGDGPACLVADAAVRCHGTHTSRAEHYKAAAKQPRLRPSSSSLLLLFPPFFSHTLPFLLSSPSPFFFLLFSPSFFLSGFLMAA